MSNFEGYCYRGPLEGKVLRHSEPVYHVRPALRLLKHGTYRFMKHPAPFRGGAWIWDVSENTKRGTQA